VRSICDLRKSGLAALQSAIDEISGIPTTMYGRDRALNSLKAIYSKIEAIDLNEFWALEEAGLTTEDYFESRMGSVSVVSSATTCCMFHQTFKKANAC